MVKLKAERYTLHPNILPLLGKTRALPERPEKLRYVVQTTVDVMSRVEENYSSVEEEVEAYTTGSLILYTN